MSTAAVDIDTVTTWPAEDPGARRTKLARLIRSNGGAVLLYLVPGSGEWRRADADLTAVLLDLFADARASEIVAERLAARSTEETRPARAGRELDDVIAAIDRLTAAVLDGAAGGARLHPATSGSAGQQDRPMAP